MYPKPIIVPKLDRIKTLDLEPDKICHIDINLWFKSNNLTPSCMNEIRQFIFEEWFTKKVTTIKNKISAGSQLIIVYDSPTDLFVDLLKEKIMDSLGYEFCDVILIEG